MGPASLTGHSSEADPKPSASASEDPRRLRFGWEAALLAALVSAIYFTRLDAVPLRGEETRWARVAWEMRQTGDYIVPRQQGHVFPDRPPLNSWCMLLASAPSGTLDRVSVRLPAALATLMTALAVYGYCRQFLTRWGAFTAGIVYATFPQTLQLGRLAESDAVFTLLVTAALLGWHTGYVRQWPAARTWVIGYALAGLAGLAKGPQGPVYFVAAVTLYLGLRRDWRFLFSLPHLAGLVGFAAVLGAWQIPFSLAAGTKSSLAVWSEEGALGHRLAGILGWKWWKHLASYPAEVFAYLLPWSVFLFWFLRRGSWRTRAAQGREVPFLLVCVAVAFPTCWLVTNARPRHLMALYPAVACLLAVAIEGSRFDRAGLRWDWGFRWFLAVLGVLAALAGVAVAIAGVCPTPPWIAALLPPSSTTAACGTAIVILAAICFWASVGADPARAALGVTAVAATLALAFVVLVLDHHARISDRVESQVATLKSEILRGERLVSFGPLYHKFTYHYQDPIEIVPWPAGNAAAETGWQYFCFMELEARAHGELPFAWDEVAVIYCDRAKEKGVNRVRVGRRKT